MSNKTKITFEISLAELDESLEPIGYSHIDINAIVSQRLLEQPKEIIAIIKIILQEKIPFFEALEMEYKILSYPFEELLDFGTCYLNDNKNTKPITHFFQNKESIDDALCNILEFFYNDEFIDIEELATHLLTK